LKALLLLLLVFLISFPSCEGDQGPVGPEGPQGESGSGIGYTNDPYLGYGWGGDFVEVATVTFEITEAQSTVFILATDNVWSAGGTACKCAVRLSFDGAADDKTMHMIDIPNTSGSNNGASVSTSAMKTFSEGSHTVTLERSGCMTDKHPHINVIVLNN
jgi:hypothetical protein